MLLLIFELVHTGRTQCGEARPERFSLLQSRDLRRQGKTRAREGEGRRMGCLLIDALHATSTTRSMVQTAMPRCGNPCLQRGDVAPIPSTRSHGVARARPRRSRFHTSPSFNQTTVTAQARPNNKNVR